MEENEIEPRDMAEVLSDILSAFLAGGADVTVGIVVHVHPKETGPLADCPACALADAGAAGPTAGATVSPCGECAAAPDCTADPEYCNGLGGVAVPDDQGEGGGDGVGH